MHCSTIFTDHDEDDDERAIGVCCNKSTLQDYLHSLAHCKGLRTHHCLSCKCFASKNLPRLKLDSLHASAAYTPRPPSALPSARLPLVKRPEYLFLIGRSNVWPPIGRGQCTAELGFFLATAGDQPFFVFVLWSVVLYFCIFELVCMCTSASPTYLYVSIRGR